MISYRKSAIISALFYLGVNMTDLKKEKPIYTRKIGINFLKHTKDEAFKIFQAITNEKKLPDYYIIELRQKNELLKEEVLSSLEIMKKSLEKDLKKNAIKNVLMASFAGINIFLLFTVPVIGLITSLIYGTYAYKDLNRLRKEQKEHPIEEESKEVFKLVNDIMTNIENNDRILECKLKESVYNTLTIHKENPSKAHTIINANTIIQEYISTGLMPKSLDEETRKTIIDLLQRDLNTNETNLEILLKETKDKVSEDTIIKKLK